MNLDEIRKRMDRLQNKSNGKSKSDYKANFWKPPSGEKSVIRIVPYKHNKEVPFTELYFYFGIDKPRMMSLSNFDESDPILEFASYIHGPATKTRRVRKTQFLVSIPDARYTFYIIYGPVGRRKVFRSHKLWFELGYRSYTSHFIPENLTKTFDLISLL